MERHRQFPVVILVVALSLTIGCGTLPGLFVTPTPLPTDTPPPTDTPVPTSTPIPTSTAPPTDTPTQPPDLSGAVLTLEDLPSGFEAMSLEEFGMTEEDLSGDDFTVESVFAFLDAGNFELVMGFTTLILNRLEQTGFDMALDQPEFLMESMIGSMGSVDILKQEALADLDDIGDASAGMTMVADIESVPMRVDLAVFRRDIVGAFIIVMYIDGDVPVVPVEEAANKLDARISEALPSD
jgi:hypothetical protein